MFRHELADRGGELPRVVGRELRRRYRRRRGPDHGRPGGARDLEDRAEIGDVVREPASRADHGKRAGAISKARGVGVAGELEHEHAGPVLEQVRGDRGSEVAQRGGRVGADRRRGSVPAGQLGRVRRLRLEGE